ncbi:hypothetical protein HII31_05665 [Pseudocercospora fuligena]|uniref:Uncharacterized protein n=1 Tax=Pseudocercospora fuligena TaxID=685502 RepID=A0A8H6RJK6_9PEZI|nr:hypothetical protein HII31_05665 [Pseudocercospora fuligena]
MGNCFGKQSSDANFSGEGRTLGAAPANDSTSANKARTAAAPKISSPEGGRTLGKNPQAPNESDSPGAAAARAAEERLKASQGKGKLGKQLDAQKAQTQTNTLAQTARDNVAARDADAAVQARNYN